VVATHSSRIGRNLAATAVLLALGLLLLAPPARSANVVNVTINIPAVVYDNPASASRWRCTATSTSC
jgi:hypothetical protein